MSDVCTEDKISTEELHKEMDLIQACVTRMADNSFRPKELYVSLMAIALTVMMSQEFELLMVSMVVLGVTVVFWGLDAFFLKMETLYRWKYEWIIEKRIAGERAYLYNLNSHNKNMWLDINNKNECLGKFVFSRTLIPLYGVSVGVALLYIIYTLIVR
ncbi:MAG: hypothetical protein UFJ18_13950 [Blautia sp.]|nr:hypothetical protein [Blautia sp.]